MNHVFFEGPVMWSQIDANMHLRHSAYADFAAQARLALLHHAGIGIEVIAGLGIGPVLFREELAYLREIQANDRVRVTAELTRCRPDGSRWSFRQEIYRGDGTKSAIVTVDGAWIDMEKRRLAALPEAFVQNFLEKVPRSADFQMDIPQPKSVSMTLAEKFAQAQSDSKNLTKRPDNDTLLRLYALFKQGSHGDAPAEGPSNPFDMVGKAKYEAWKKLAGTSVEAAQEAYVTLVTSLKNG